MVEYTVIIFRFSNTLQSLHTHPRPKKNQTHSNFKNNNKKKNILCTQQRLDSKVKMLLPRLVFFTSETSTFKRLPVRALLSLEDHTRKEHTQTTVLDPRFKGKQITCGTVNRPFGKFASLNTVPGSDKYVSDPYTKP